MKGLFQFLVIELMLQKASYFTSSKSVYPRGKSTLNSNNESK